MQQVIHERPPEWIRILLSPIDGKIFGKLINAFPSLSIYQTRLDDIYSGDRADIIYGRFGYITIVTNSIHLGYWITIGYSNDDIIYISIRFDSSHGRRKIPIEATLFAKEIYEHYQITESDRVRLALGGGKDILNGLIDSIVTRLRQIIEELQ